MKRIIKTFALVASMSLGLTACSDDYFDQEAYENLLTKSFPVKDVNPNHNWATIGTASASFTVNGDYGADYTVVVYQENPLYATSLTELYKASVKSGETRDCSFSYLLAKPTVYMAAYDKNGSRVVKSLNILSGEKLNVNFFGDATATRTRAVEDATIYPDYVKTLNDYLNFQGFSMWNNTFTMNTISVEAMKQYTPLTNADMVIGTNCNNTTLSDKQYMKINNQDVSFFIANGDGKHYRIPANTELTTVFHINGAYGQVNDAVIYVEGTLHLNGNTLNGPTIVVAPGGQLVVDGNTNTSNAGRIIIMEGGSMSGADGVTFAVNNAGPCYNAGTIEYNGELNVNGSDFYNKGTIKVDVLRNTSGGKFTNFGTIEARTNTQAGDSYNSVVINGCYMFFTENAGIGTLVMLDDSRLDVGGIAEFNQATQTLYNRSMINVGTLYVNSTTFMGTDNTSDFAIIKMDKVFFAGEMYINQNKDDKYQNARWTWIARKIDGKSTIYLDWDDSETYTNVGKITLDNGYTMLSVVRGSEYNYINEDTAPAGVAIEPSECAGTGYSGGGGNIPAAKPLGLRFCFEDNYPSPGDYDFNDCVVTLIPVVDANDAKKVTITVTLEAAGGIKQIAGLLHIKGLPRNAIYDISADEDFDKNLPVENYMVAAEDYNNTHQVAVNDMEEQKNINNADVVLRLFEDLHWSLSGTTNSYGGVQRIFYNTVTTAPSGYNDYQNGVGPVESVITITLRDAKWSELFTEANLDMFIVERHNSICQEVHTKPFKDDNVLNYTHPAMSTGNYVWAISIPGTTRYPIEWHSISGEEGYGYTNAAYPKFVDWVQGAEDSDDWYTEPVDSLVY